MKDSADRIRRIPDRAGRRFSRFPGRAGGRLAACALPVLLACTAATEASATGLAAEVERPDSVRILFRQGRHDIDLSLGNNRSSLRELKRLFADSASRKDVSRVRIVGTASPEGSVSLNYRLSDSRARQLQRFLPLSFLPDTALTTSFTGRDWDGLLKEVQQNPDVPYRAEVIALLQEITARDTRAGTEQEDFRNLSRLQELAGGIPYRYLYSTLFPGLRATDIFIDYLSAPGCTDLIPVPPEFTASRLPVPGTAPDLALLTPYPDGNPGLRPGKRKRDFYMSVKTNLLYDAALLPTLGAEFYLGKNISIAGEWTYGWWDNDRRHRYWRAYGGDLSLRWWFGEAAHRKPLTGHHIGIYTGVTTFDFEFGGEGCMGGLPGGTLWDRCMIMGGVEYGYSLPLAKRLNMDFTIGIGYMGGKYLRYVPDHSSYLWKSTHRLNWIGPTKAEISLIWLIGHGNQNRKGGVHP